MDIFTRIIFWQIWGGMQLNIRRILFEAKCKCLFCMIRPSFLKRKEKVHLVIVNYCICYVLYQWKSISLPEPWSYSYEQEWLQTIWGSTSWSPRVWDRVWGWSTPKGYGEESAWNQCYSWKVNNKPRTILHDIIHSIMIGLELLQGKSGKWKYYIHASELVMYIVRLKTGWFLSAERLGHHFHIHTRGCIV